MNRRIRNRTYGGVGGRRAQALLLPDLVAYRLADSGVIEPLKLPPFSLLTLLADGVSDDS